MSFLTLPIQFFSPLLSYEAFFSKKLYCVCVSLCYGACRSSGDPVIRPSWLGHFTAPGTVLFKGRLKPQSLVGILLLSPCGWSHDPSFLSSNNGHNNQLHSQNRKKSTVCRTVMGFADKGQMFPIICKSRSLSSLFADMFIHY